jgi:hypothetical protein
VIRRTIRVIHKLSGDVVQEVDVTGKSDWLAQSVIDGLLSQLDLDRFLIEGSSRGHFDFSDPEEDKGWSSLSKRVLRTVSPETGAVGTVWDVTDFPDDVVKKLKAVIYEHVSKRGVNVEDYGYGQFTILSSECRSKSQALRAIFSGLDLDERLKRTCSGCGLAPIAQSGLCAVCGTQKLPWQYSEFEQLVMNGTVDE